MKLKSIFVVLTFLYVSNASAITANSAHGLDTDIHGNPVECINVEVDMNSIQCHSDIGFTHTAAGVCNVKVQMKNLKSGNTYENTLSATAFNPFIFGMSLDLFNVVHYKNVAREGLVNEILANACAE